MPTLKTLHQALAAELDQAGFEAGTPQPEPIPAGSVLCSAANAIAVARDLQRLHERVVSFQRSRFPNQPLRAKLTHLAKEVQELRDCDGKDPMEWADVFLLLLGSADLEGHDLLSLVYFGHAKMNINEGRDWHAADADGVHHHKES